MSDPVWYRSLYWRIAFGFIALLAILLLAQGVLFLWLTDRFVGSSSRTPAQLAALVAAEVATELERHPELDVEQFVRNRFSHIYQPFLVMLRDGRHGSNRPTALPPELGRALEARMRGGGPPREGFGRRGGARIPLEFEPVVVRGEQTGVVAVPATPPPVSVALKELGPTLTWFGLGILAVGATVTALLIFRPAHNRLRISSRPPERSAKAAATFERRKQAVTKSARSRARSTAWPPISTAALRR